VRILHLCSYSLYSGPVPPTVGLALAQRALGHTVFLALDTKRGAFNDYEEAAAPRVAGLRLEPPVRLTLSTKSSPVELWRDFAALRRLLARGDIDVVHAHLSHDHALAALALPRGAATACVRTFHAARSLGPRLGQAWMNRRARVYIVRSAAHREELVGRFGVPAERVHAVPGGIDAIRFSPASAAARAQARERLGLPPDALVLAHVALIAGRGQEELASAVALLSEPRPFLLFVGRGEREAQLRAHVRSLGLSSRARFAGYLAGDALLDAYAAADAAFLAQAGNDASARAGLEAMAGGVPLVVVGHDALAELAQDDRALVASERTPEAIAAALAALVADVPGARARAARAREFVLAERTFGAEAERTLAAYHQARGGGR